MNPHTAFSQMLLTESQRHPDPSTISPPAKKSDDDDEGAPSTESPSPSHASLMPPTQTLAIALSRMGTPDQRLVSGTLAELAEISEEEYGSPLHTVVVVGKRLHPLELEYAGQFAVGGEKGQWWKVGKEVYGVEREGRS